MQKVKGNKDKCWNGDTIGYVVVGSVFTVCSQNMHLGAKVMKNMDFMVYLDMSTYLTPAKS
jgi:hypothetical protein